MKTKWTARTLLAELLNRVEPTPEGEEQGGGQEAGKATGAKDPAAAGDDEDMGPAGQDALRKERDRVRALERQLGELKNMSPQIAEQVAEARRRVEEADERVRRAEEDKTRAVDETRRRLDEKHKRDRDSLQAERDAAIAAKEQLAIRTAFNEAFNAADGRRQVGAHRAEGLAEPQGGQQQRDRGPLQAGGWRRLRWPPRRPRIPAHPGPRPQGPGQDDTQPAPEQRLPGLIQ